MLHNRSNIKNNKKSRCSGFGRIAFFSLLTAVLLFSFSFPAIAQEEEPSETPPESESIFLGQTNYVQGDQFFVINAGLNVPLFFQALSGKVMSTNLSLGGNGSIEWQSYLTNRVSLGVELGGMFTLSPNSNTLVMASLSGKASYLFTAQPFEFPVFIGTGLNISRYQDYLHFEPILKPGASFYWNYNSDWAFGLNTAYWWVPQIYFGFENGVPAEESRFGNFLELSLSVLYHFN